MTGKHNLNLIVTEERIAETPLEIFYFLEDGGKIIIDYIAHFVADESGNYLPHKDAVAKVINGRTMKDLEEIGDQLRNAIEEGVVPNV